MKSLQDTCKLDGHLLVKQPDPQEPFAGGAGRLSEVGQEGGGRLGAVGLLLSDSLLRDADQIARGLLAERHAAAYSHEVSTEAIDGAYRHWARVWRVGRWCASEGNGPYPVTVRSGMP